MLKMWGKCCCLKHKRLIKAIKIYVKQKTQARKSYLYPENTTKEISSKLSEKQQCLKVLSSFYSCSCWTVLTTETREAACYKESPSLPGELKSTIHSTIFWDESLREMQWKGQTSLHRSPVWLAWLHIHTHTAVHFTFSSHFKLTISRKLYAEMPLSHSPQTSKIQRQGLIVRIAETQVLRVSRHLSPVEGN